MSHSDRSDYLWDRSGTPDPFVVELETLLEPLAHKAGPRPPRRRTRWAIPLAAAALVVLGVALSLALPDRDPSWRLDTVHGSPRLSSRAVSDAAPWRPGSWLETDAASSARLRSDEVGWVTVNPDTRLRLKRAARGEHRIELAEGSIEAFILAPPRVFIVDTPAVTAVDMGCAYTLDVDARGDGAIRVTSGWVYLELPGTIAARVPAGAWCPIRAGAGAGLPRFADASAAFVEALDRLHAGRSDALDTLLDAARPRDSLTLWHLAQILDAAQRPRVIDRLDQLAPRPEGVRAGDDLTQDELDRWWRSIDEAW